MMLCFVLFLMSSSLALGQQCDSLRASETVLNDMGKINQYQNTTKHNKMPTIGLFFGMNSQDKILALMNTNIADQMRVSSLKLHLTFPY